MSTDFAPRSALFVPATSTDKFAKVARVRPDAMVVDLEDAVPPAAKPDARTAALQALATERPGAGRILVRINGVGTPWHDDDVRATAVAVANGALDGVVLPKYEHPDELAALRAALPAAALVMVGMESALGVADARSLLTTPPTVAGPDAVFFGAEDYIADLGGRRTASHLEVLYARSQVILAARLAGIAALDQVVVAVHDAEAFRADAELARALGYPGKLCLHPQQVTLAHEVFTPSPAEIAHARAVLAAATSDGVALLDGQMIDAVHLTMARATLARAPG